MDEEQVKSFQEAAKPLIKWLNENCNPHTEVMVGTVFAELKDCKYYFRTEEFLKD